MKNILSISILLSTTTFASLTANYDENNIYLNTINDNSTSLVWQDETQHLSWNEGISYCENLTLAGFSNWRLPNANEAMSIVDETEDTPAISNIFLSITESSDYWTSTTSSSNTEEARVVNFRYGTLKYGYDKESERHVRCVGDLPHYNQVRAKQQN